MNDDSIMAFGKHKGKPMIEVPDDWLLWLWGQNKRDFKENNTFALNPDQIEVMEYIEDCFDAHDLL